MGQFSIWHWLVVLVIVMLLFGAGKIPRLMSDVAKGVKAFKSGLKEEETTAANDAVQPSPTVIPPAEKPKETVTAEKKVSNA